MVRRAQPRPVFPHRLSNTIRYLFAAFLSASQVFAPSVQGVSTTLQTPPGRKVPTLEVGKTVERELTGNQTHTYELPLMAGQYLHVVTYQKDLLVTTTLFGADGRIIVADESPNVPFGIETVSVISETAGTYRIAVRAIEGNMESGRYEIQLEELRAATLQDKERVTAHRLFLEAEYLAQPTAKPDHPALLRKAIEKYEAALQLNRSLTDRFSEALTLHGLGQAYHQLGESAAALDHYQRSLAIWQSLGNQGWGNLFANLSPLYLVLGGKQQAADYLSQALPLVRALHNRKLEAILMTGLARIYSDLSDPQQALAQYRQALALYRILGKRGDEAITITDIADADLSLEERQKAISYLQQALPIVRAVQDRSLEATMLFGIGYVYNLLDERQKALEYYEQALPIFRALNDRNSEAYMLSFIGGFYSSLGEEQKAIDDYEQALALFRALNDRKAEAYTLLRLGAAYRLSLEQQKGLNLLNDALALMRDTGERSGEASTLALLGDFYYSSGDRQKAMEAFNQALRLWRAVGYRDGEAATLVSLGFTHELFGNREQALACHKQALALFRLMGTRYGEAGALYGMARIDYTRGNLSDARQEIEAALAIIESLRAKLAGQEVRAAFVASNQHYYNFYVEVLMQLHKSQPAKGFDGEALQAAERARARSLLEILTESRADIRQGVDPLLLERERNLQQQLNVKEQLRMQLVNRKTKPEPLAKVEKEIRAITTEYQEVQAQIRVKSPRYAALTQPQTLTLKEIQQQTLDADTLLLEYTLGPDRSYLWAVSAETISSFELPKREVIEKAARNFYQALSAPNQPVERRTDQSAKGQTTKTNPRPSDPKSVTTEPAKRVTAAEAAATLSRLLLDPVASRLGAKRLVIVADGALQYIPFAALPEPAAGSQSPVAGNNANANRPPATDYRPLVVGHEIVNLPSASTLAVLRRETAGRNRALKTIAVLADPVFSKEDQRVKRNNPKGDDKSLQRTPGKTRAGEIQLEKSAKEAGVANPSLQIPRLIGTRLEAAGILELVPEAQRKQALDFSASRATATSEELGRYSIIHFATHGMLNSIHPELSGIILSLVDEQGQNQDGFLRLHEIYNLRLPVELVVLSACQTGLGKEIRGEGLVGLTRGFMYAGSPSVVASLWKVDDEATAELMKRFYRGMVTEGLRPAAALRTAQIEMWKQPRYTEPYYWAAFILQGEWK
jgi:CHAT domain-containing protein